jgi:ureidoglycolate hydrolase
MRTIQVQPLQQDTFAPYGNIVDGILNQAAPTEDDERLLTWLKGAELPSFQGDGLAVYLVTKHRQFIVGQLEVHRVCAPLIVPVSGTAFIPVANSKENGDPDIDHMAAFILEQGQAVVLHPGVWFVVPYPMGKRAEYIFVIRKSTPSMDTRLLSIEPVSISI